MTDCKHAFNFVRNTCPWRWISNSRHFKSCVLQAVGLREKQNIRELSDIWMKWEEVVPRLTGLSPWHFEYSYTPRKRKSYL